MRLERTPGREAPAGDGVVLNVADAPLVLALGARTIRRAGNRPHVPVAGERMQAIGELHLTRDRIVVLDQSTSVVEQQLARHPTKMEERAFDPFQPRRLLFMSKRCGINPARVAQGGDEQEHFVPLALDRDPALAEVDLQLSAGRRLEADRGQRFGRQLAPQMRHRPLHRAQADHNAQSRCQLLAHHVRIAPMTSQRVIQPGCMTRQQAGPGRNPTWRPGTRRQKPLNRLPIASNLRCDPPGAPTQAVKPLHRRHLVRRPLTCLRPSLPSGDMSNRSVILPLPATQGGWVPGVVSGWVYPVA